MALRFATKYLVIGLALALGTPALAAKKKKAASEESESGGKAPYGMAGCGFGAAVIENHNSRLAQLGATFLNGISGNQTSGITSGTSNCVESRTEVAAMEQEVFVTANLATLSREAAQGQGESLKALAEVFGCSQSEGAEQLARLSQARYHTLFGNQDPKAVLGNYLSEINSNEDLASDCKLAS